MDESSKSKSSEYDPITYHHWQEFEIRRLKRSSEDFQQLFEDIMVRVKPGFIRVRPYGNIGDRKCDGLFRDSSTFFQVYSPDELEQAKVQKKIDEDLEGAVAHWKNALKEWVFVYNVKRGLPPDILGTLSEKQQQYSDIQISHLSNDDLWEFTRNLSVEQRNEILGLPPSTASQSSSNIQGYGTNWRETCRGLLHHWKGLTTNALMKPNGICFQLDEIFVPLGVVERRVKPKHHSNNHFSAEQGSELYEEKITPISQNEFFEQVLQQRQSKHSQGSRIAIIGEPGAGKTTQLQKIGDWILEKTDGIPIWIPLAEVGTRKLREYLLDDWLQTAIQELETSPEHRGNLGQLLKTGKVWLLLDGVDEMAVSDALYQIATQMREGWLQNVRVVLTCRLNVWDVGKNALDGFDVYRNLDFDYPTEVHQFIDKWFLTDPESQHNLKVALEQPGKERIRDMVKNPLRLTLLCYSWQLRQGELAETKAGLYEWFVDAFYEWNKGKVPIKLNAAKRNELNYALGALAKEAIDRERSRFRLQERFVNQFLGAVDDKDSLFGLALQLGWLNYVGVAAENPLENVYAFFHPTFQEYFAALAIIDWDYFFPCKHENTKPEPLKGKKYRVFDPYWQEVILLWLGQSSGKIASNLKEDFIDALMRFQDGCGELYKYKSYFMAARGANEYSGFSQPRTIIDKIIKWSIGCIDIEEKEKWIGCFLESIFIPANSTLSSFPRSEVVSRLKSFTLNENNQIRKSAKFALDKVQFLSLDEGTQSSQEKDTSKREPRRLIPDNINLGDLIKKLRSSNSLSDIYWTADTILSIDASNQVAIDALNHLLDDCQDEWILWLTANRILDAWPNNEKAIQSLVKLLYASQYDIPWRAAESLGDFGLGNWTAIKGLVNILKDTSIFQDVTNEWALVYEWTLVNAAHSLVKIAQCDSYSYIVFQLKDNINSQAFSESFSYYRWCRNLLWDLTQDMSYPDFFNAWHSSPLGVSDL